MAGFHEIRLPTNYGEDSGFGPGFNTAIVPRDSGWSVSFERWESQRNHAVINYKLRTLDDLSAILTFFHARKGSACGFRLKDLADYTTAANGRDNPTPFDVTIPNLSGYRLRKLYGTDVRYLLKPVAGTVRVADNGVELTSGWSVSTTTGIITFVSPPVGPVSAGCQFDVPVRFVTEKLELSHDDFETGSTVSLELVEMKVAL